MFGLSFSEILVILIVVLIFFGPERLPELSRTIGRTLGTFRRSMDELRSDFTMPDFDRWAEGDSQPRSQAGLGLTTTAPLQVLPEKIHEKLHEGAVAPEPGADAPAAPSENVAGEPKTSGE